MSGYSLGEQLTDAHGRIVDLETELRCTEGDLAVAVAEAQRARQRADHNADAVNANADLVVAARAEADALRLQLLDETYRPEGGLIVLRELRGVQRERDAARAVIAAAREFVESAWGRAEQAAEQVNRIPAAGVAQAFADLADILGSDRDGDG